MYSYLEVLGISLMNNEKSSGLSIEPGCTPETSGRADDTVLLL